MDNYFPQKAKRIFSLKGKDLIEEIGLDIIKGVVSDVLTGKNLRDSTEFLTRKRIISLNAATLVMFIRGASKESNLIKNLPKFAYKRLVKGSLKREDKWLMQWILGLTDKAFQNVLRDDTSSLARYKENYLKIIQEAIGDFRKEYGDLTGTISLDSKEKALLNWEFLILLMNTIGSQTLAIRGSDKSTFGKLFEKLILGSLLSVLDFKLVHRRNIKETNRIFWLSSREEKRESDATLLYAKGKGVRFDIGFIGRGNPEISLDKVSRFERELEMGRQKWYLTTIIIVDRIGVSSRIQALAKLINGHIVQMSGAYWPIEVAKILNHIVGYKNKILSLRGDELETYFRSKLNLVPFEEILNITSSNNKDESSDPR